MSVSERDSKTKPNLDKGEWVGVFVWVSGRVCYYSLFYVVCTFLTVSGKESYALLAKPKIIQKI